jgi:adenosylcobyric acid synthase
MGETTVVEDNFLRVQTGNNSNAETEEEKDAPLLEFTPNGSGYTKGNIFGTYVHGIFDDAQIVKTIVNEIAMKKGVSLELDEVIDYAELKDKEYDKLAAMMREYMNMEMVYELLGMKERR